MLEELKRASRLKQREARHTKASKRTRTADPFLTMEVLYLLSYGSIILNLR